MRLLANENFPGEAVEALRQEGHDLVWIRTDAPGNSDRKVLEKAQKEEKILLTIDKDFEELAYRFKLPASCGIIPFRLSAPSPSRLVSLIITALKSRTDWTGNFSVIEAKRIRMAPLPGSKKNLT